MRNLSQHILTIAPLGALILSPFMALLIDENILSYKLNKYIDVQDFIHIFIIIILSLIVIADRFYSKIRNFFRLNAFYSSIDHNYSYSSDGTVIVRSSYKLVNGWRRNLGLLPKENLVWHSKVSENDIIYRLFFRDKFAERKLISSTPFISPSQLFAGDNFLSWQPKIFPEMQRNEEIHFMVEIKTPSTELIAFESTGTKMGFGVQLPTASAGVTAFAPFGYKFVLIGPRVSLRNAETLAEIPNSANKLPQPTISPDGSILRYSVSRPQVGKRYWIHYRFEKWEEST